MNDSSKENEYSSNSINSNQCLKQITMYFRKIPTTFTPDRSCLVLWYFKMQQLPGFHFMASPLLCNQSQASQPSTHTAFHSLFMETTYKNKLMHCVVPATCKVRFLVKMPTKLTDFTLCSHGSWIKLKIFELHGHCF